MAGRKVKYMFSSLLLAFILLVGACAGGFYFFIKVIVDNYNDPNLEYVIEQTKNSEGFCLTDLAQENNLTFSSKSELFKEACVSVVVTVNGSRWLGSGVCVASKGYEYEEGKTLESGSYIVTNYHVIEEIYKVGAFSTKVEVYPNDYANKQRYSTTVPYEAEVLWSDSYLDGAIIYVEENIDWVRMKDRSINCEDSEMLNNNERAFVIGSPLELENQNTITTGYITKDSLNYSYTEESGIVNRLSNIYEYLIPIRITIHGGNSGGGLFDGSGYLVGQPTLGNSEDPDSVNYAIPIYSATLIIDDIIDTNEGDEELVKIYSKDYFEICTIDYYEADVMKVCYTGKRKYFYGKEYPSETLKYDRKTGLKVLADNEEYGFVSGDIILSVKIRDKETEITCRNDFIFALLEARKGDIVQFNVEDKTAINVELA